MCVKKNDSANISSIFRSRVNLKPIKRPFLIRQSETFRGTPTKLSSIAREDCREWIPLQIFRRSMALPRQKSCTHFNWIWPHSETCYCVSHVDISLLDSSWQRHFFRIRIPTTTTTASSIYKITTQTIQSSNWHRYKWPYSVWEFVFFFSSNSTCIDLCLHNRQTRISELKGTESNVGKRGRERQSKAALLMSFN